MTRSVLPVLVMLALAACTSAPLPAPAPVPDEATLADDATIGVATLLADGTLVLHLYAPLEGGRGEAEFRYAPGTPDHAEVLTHIGGLRPGQSKPVPPWPDTP